jgi:hypothetical protein
VPEYIDASQVVSCGIVLIQIGRIDHTPDASESLQRSLVSAFHDQGATIVLVTHKRVVHRYSSARAGQRSIHHAQELFVMFTMHDSRTGCLPTRLDRPRLARLPVAAIAALVLWTGAARADDAASGPLNYVMAGVGTTPAHRPSSGPVDGWQHDVSPSVGFGRFVSATIALEVDIGLTLVRGDYAGASLVPGVVWAFSSHVYAATRVVVPVDPKVNVGLYPGLGVVHTFDNGIGVFAEGNVFSYVGRGNPDLGVALSAGALYSF